MKYIYALNIFFYLLLNSQIGFAQTADQFDYKRARNAVVEITSVKEGLEEVGTGIVVAKIGDKLWIVTARHVTSDADTVSIKLEGQKKNITGYVEFKHSYYDLAVITATSSNYQFSDIRYFDGPQGGDVVFSIGSRFDKAILPVNITAQIIENDSQLIKATLGAQKGDSGSPIFCMNYFAGVIYEAPGLAFPVKLIRSIMDDLEYPWQLSPADRPKDDFKVEKPDVDKLVSHKIESIKYNGVNSKSNLNEIIDGNKTTYWACEDAGWQTLKIHLSRPVIIKEIRFYYPETYALDVPKGYFTLSNSDRKISLQSSLKKFMVKEGSGSWSVFDFKSYQTESDIFIHFKIDKDNKEKPYSEWFFEIKVMGPSN